MRGVRVLAFSVVLVAVSVTSTHAQVPQAPQGIMGSGDAAMQILQQEQLRRAALARQQQLDALANKALCADAGALAQRRFRQEWSRESFNRDGMYAYNAALNTCLYADVYSDSDPEGQRLLGYTSRTIAFVQDALTGKILLEYIAYDGTAIPGSLSKAEFLRRFGRLMDGQ